MWKYRLSITHGNGKTDVYYTQSLWDTLKIQFANLFAHHVEIETPSMLETQAELDRLRAIRTAQLERLEKTVKECAAQIPRKQQ